MSTQLTPQSFDLPRIDGWATPDSRRLEFVVTQDGAPKDISNDHISWWLLNRPYQPRAEAVVDGEGTEGVSIRTESVVDPIAGEFRVDIAAGTLDGEWGEYTQVVRVDPPGESQLTWRGPVVLEHTGE